MQECLKCTASFVAVSVDRLGAKLAVDTTGRLGLVLHRCPRRVVPGFDVVVLPGRVGPGFELNL